MSIYCIQNQLLEVTVVECAKLKDTEWISRQDPYVWLEYGSTKFRTRTCTDGGKTPVFQEKFMFTLIEGLREINVMVWNSNTLRSDDFIGSGKIQLQGVLARGYDDKCWPIHSKSGRFAGEVKLIMHFAPSNAPAVGYAILKPHRHLFLHTQTRPSHPHIRLRVQHTHIRWLIHPILLVPLPIKHTQQLRIHLLPVIHFTLRLKDTRQLHTLHLHLHMLLLMVLQAPMDCTPHRLTKIKEASIVEEGVCSS